MDPSTGEDRPDSDTAEPFAATLPMAAEAKGWMVSSMDLMAGVDILEGEQPQTGLPGPETGPVHPRHELP